MKKGKGYPEHVKDTGKSFGDPYAEGITVLLISGPKKHGKHRNQLNPPVRVPCTSRHGHLG